MSIEVMLSLLAEGMVTSVELFALTLLFSLPLGMGLALVRMSKNGLLRNVSKFYISVMRGTPLMLQLFVVYYGPYYLFGMSLSKYSTLMASTIAFVLNYAAYFAEIYRAGIESMPVGQYEAAKVLGYTRSQTFFRIILPQVIKRVLPPVTNEMITLVKDTSLAFSIGLLEMFTQAKAIVAHEKNMTAYFIAAVFYYVFNFAVAAVMERAEKKLRYYQ